MFTVKPEVNYVERYMRSKKPHFLTQRSWPVCAERYSAYRKSVMLLNMNMIHAKFYAVFIFGLEFFVAYGFRIYKVVSHNK